MVRICPDRNGIAVSVIQDGIILSDGTQHFCAVSIFKDWYWKEIVRQRKSIIEHVFGTVKRAFGISYLLLKGKKKVEGEISLAFLALIIKRAINILGTQRLIAAIKAA